MKTRASCTPEIFERIIASLYEGKLPAHVVEDNRDNPNFPTLSTIHKYAIADIARKKAYMSAREACADMLADQVVFHADSNVDPQRASNRMKSRQWLASKLQPKVYGDKLDIDLNNKVDVSVAILHARQRAGHVIEHAPQSTLTTSDIESDDNASVLETNPPIDPFS